MIEYVLGDIMKKEILELADSIYKLNKIRCELFKEEKDYIINNNIKDSNQIEHAFNSYIDMIKNPKVANIYLDLCDYYWKIDMEAADFYYSCYLENVADNKGIVKQKKLG